MSKGLQNIYFDFDQSSFWNSNLSLSVTGIAGPSGGTTFKPTGTVYFGLSNDLGERMYKHTLFKGSREEVRIQSIFYGLTFLYEFIT